MRKIGSKIVLAVLCLPVLSMFSATSAHAVTLSNAKDTISTSRPSASAYINPGGTSPYGATDTVVSIVNNGSRYLASDSARIIGSPGAVIGNPLSVASQSADLTSVYLGNSGGSAAGSTALTDLLIMPVTAKHTIQFTTPSGSAATGKIVVTFPGSGSNIASPSATTFSFNGLASGNISTTGASCGSYTISAPTITCNLNAVLSPSTVVVMTIGNTTPQLINPTKAAAAGSNDSWTLNLQVTDSTGTPIDSAKIGIATIDSVKVTADVDPSLTFTISGINSGNVSSAVTSCSGTDALSNVPASTATEVSLGFLRNGIINLSAQKLTVATNGSQGYVISATSSGQFINPATGYWIKGLNGDTALSANDVTAPATFGANPSEGFGISACGTPALVNTNQWGTANCSTGFSCGWKYSNPYNTGTNSFYATIASYTGGAVDATSANGQVAVKYAATVNSTTPPGTYRTIFTYVATATF
jgi:hypothetical protein